MKMPMLSIGMLVMLITGASADLSTGDTISYASGNCPFDSSCDETCVKGGYSVIKQSDRITFTPKSGVIGGCSCDTQTYEGAFSGSTLTGTGDLFTITSTSSTVVISIPSSSCSATFNIDTSSSSGITLNGLLGLISATVVAFVLV